MGAVYPAGGWSILFRVLRTVIVRDYGTFVGKRGERLLLRRPVKTRAPEEPAPPEPTTYPGGGPKEPSLPGLGSPAAPSPTA